MNKKINEKLNKKQLFICDICGKELYTNKGAFANHKKSHDHNWLQQKAIKISKSKKAFYQDKERSKYAREKSREYMKKNNPMFRKEVIDKMVQSRKKYFESLSDEEYNKIVQNFINAPKKGNAVNHKGKYTPTKIEQMIIDFNIPNLIYNGNKKNGITIRFKNKNYKRSLTPDFISKDGTKIVEVFGVYWHPKEDEEKYIKACEENGYKILIIWEDELYDNPEYQKERILKFLES